MHIRVLDLDGGITAQTEFMARHAATVVPLLDWGPSIRICCSHLSYRRFEQDLADRCADGEAPAISFCGSGDFHHVTFALLRRRREPFNLLILDKHPDWMNAAPIMHCGTWVSHVLRLPNLQRAFHLGADLDLDNWLRWFAPWAALREGKITTAPALRRLTIGNWARVPNQPLRVEPDRPMRAERLDELFAGARSQLGGFPLYISIDKDLLRTADAVVNWDSGRLELSEILASLNWFIAAARGRVIGMDVTGDWSQARMQGLLRGMLNLTEHPRLQVDPQEAAVVNGRTNQALVETVEQAIAAAG
jgi:hypothetical protein